MRCAGSAPRFRSPPTRPVTRRQRDPSSVGIISRMRGHIGAHDYFACSSLAALSASYHSFSARRRLRVTRRLFGMADDPNRRSDAWSDTIAVSSSARGTPGRAPGAVVRSPRLSRSPCRPGVDRIRRLRIRTLGGGRLRRNYRARRRHAQALTVTSNQNLTRARNCTDSISRMLASIWS